MRYLHYAVYTWCRFGKRHHAEDPYPKNSYLKTMWFASKRHSTRWAGWSWTGQREAQCHILHPLILKQSTSFWGYFSSAPLILSLKVAIEKEWESKWSGGGLKSGLEISLPNSPSQILIGNLFCFLIQWIRGWKRCSPW